MALLKSLRPVARLEDYQLIAKQPCEYLVQEASMAFVKTMMSVFGFPRFIPASRFFANAGETVTDLSSASVMGRQVLEDTISFFYLSEPNLTSTGRSSKCGTITGLGRMRTPAPSGKKTSIAGDSSNACGP
jgi:hypothetical protein